MNRPIHICLWILLGFCFGMVFYILISLLYPYKTIQVLNQPMPVIPHEVEQGTNNFVVKIHYIKYIDADIHTARHLECTDGSLITMASDERNFPLGENTVYANHTTIPDYAPVGECKIVFTVNYDVNPIRTITQRFETEYFLVTAGDN